MAIMAKKAGSFASRKLSPVKMKRGKQHCAALSSCVFAPTVLFTYLCFLFRCEIIHDVELLANLLGKQVCTKSDSISSGSYIPFSQHRPQPCYNPRILRVLALNHGGNFSASQVQEALDVLSQEGGPSFTHMTYHDMLYFIMNRCWSVIFMDRC